MIQDYRKKHPLVKEKSEGKMKKIFCYMIQGLAVLILLTGCSSKDDTMAIQIVGKWKMTTPIEAGDNSLTFLDVFDYQKGGAVTYAGQITLYDKLRKTTITSDVVWHGEWQITLGDLFIDWTERQTNQVKIENPVSKVMKTDALLTYQGNEIPATLDLSEQMPAEEQYTLSKMETKTFWLKDYEDAGTLMFTRSSW